MDTEDYRHIGHLDAKTAEAARIVIPVDGAVGYDFYVFRGRQYELPPEPARQPASDASKPFAVMLRRPGSSTVYVGPRFDDPEAFITTADFYDGSDPRWGQDKDQHWALSLPHKCDEWTIGEGDRADVLAEARRLRDELDQAIAAMEAADD